MEHQELASRFAAFCGIDRFRKFVLQLNRQGRGKGRLLFWQEGLGAEFARTQAAAYGSPEDTADPLGWVRLVEEAVFARRPGRA